MILPAGGGLTVHCLPLGELQTNCWVLAIEAQGEESGGACWIVDPDDDAPLTASKSAASCRCRL